jgi:hypothetical protein
MTDTLKPGSHDQGQRELDDEKECVGHGAEYSRDAERMVFRAVRR